MLDLGRLSAEQRAVVLAPDGPLLVVAGPGSGKTTGVTRFAETKNSRSKWLVLWRMAS